MITVDDLLEFGYKKYPTPLHLKGVSDFYQKKIVVPEDDDCYYIDVLFYRMLDGDSNCNIVEFANQFSPEVGVTFNVSTVGWANERSTLEQAEDFFRAQYELSKVFRKLKEH